MRPNPLTPFLHGLMCVWGTIGCCSHLENSIKSFKSSNSYRFQSVMWTAITAKTPEILHDGMQKGSLNSLSAPSHLILRKNQFFLLSRKTIVSRNKECKAVSLRWGLPPLTPARTAPRRLGRTCGRKQGRTDGRKRGGRTGGRTDGRTEGRTDGHSVERSDQF